MVDQMSEFQSKYFRYRKLRKSVFISSNELEINGTAKKAAELNGFEIKSYGFSALKEDLRQPRVVKIGAVQNAIAAPTTDPIHKQRDAIFSKIGKIVDAAGADGVNVLCLQEAWSKKTISFRKTFSADCLLF